MFPFPASSHSMLYSIYVYHVLCIMYPQTHHRRVDDSSICSNRQDYYPRNPVFSSLSRTRHSKQFFSPINQNRVPRLVPADKVSNEPQRLLFITLIIRSVPTNSRSATPCPKRARPLLGGGFNGCLFGVDAIQRSHTHPGPCVVSFEKLLLARSSDLRIVSHA